MSLILSNTVISLKDAPRLFVFFFISLSTLTSLFSLVHAHSHTCTHRHSLSCPFSSASLCSSGQACNWQTLQLGTVRPWNCVCVCVCCLLLLCQSTSLKYQLGTQTHNQNKLAALNPLVGVYVCMCLCARSGECMHVFMAVCVRARDADWTPFLLSLIEARGDTNTDLPQMNA